MRGFHRVASLALLAGAAIASILAPIARGDAVPVSGSVTESLNGDHPPQPYYEFNGQGGMVHSVVVWGNGTPFEGLFTVAGIPAGATVAKAILITGAWDFHVSPTHSIFLVFNGVTYGTLFPNDVDPNDTPDADLDLSSYLVDVTANVSGNGLYPITIGHGVGTGPFGALLVVTYAEAGSPFVQILINAGGESIANSASITTFSGAMAGASTLHIFTEADQEGSSDGEESITFGGSVIAGGPGSDLFNNNQGGYASYFELPVSATDGLKTAGIVTGTDWFGWHFAALVTRVGVTGAHPSTWGRIKSLYR